MDEVAAESCRACGAPVRVEVQRQDGRPGGAPGQVRVRRICTSLICETNMHPYDTTGPLVAP